MVHAHFGQNGRNGEWMVDIGFARFSHLAGVGNFRKVVGAYNLIDLIWL